MVNIVGLTPGTVDPVGTRLKDIVLEIHLIDDHDTLWSCFLCQFVHTAEVPWVELCEVIPAQSVPGLPLSAACKSLFVERRPHVAVLAPYTFVVVTSPVVPETIVLVKEPHTTCLQMGYDTIDTVGGALSLHPGDEARDGIGELCHGGVADTPVPPGTFSLTASERLAVEEKLVALLRVLHQRLLLRCRLVIDEDFSLQG